MWGAIRSSSCSDRELSQLMTATLDSSLGLAPEAAQLNASMRALSTLLKISSRQTQDGMVHDKADSGTGSEAASAGVSGIQTIGADDMVKNIQISRETWGACRTAECSDRDAGRLWQAALEEVFTGSSATSELSGTMGAIARLLAACIRWETEQAANGGTAPDTRLEDCFAGGCA